MEKFKEDIGFYLSEAKRLFPDVADRIVIADKAFSVSDGILTDIKNQLSNVVFDPAELKELKDGLNDICDNSFFKIYMAGKILPLEASTPECCIVMPLPSDTSPKQFFKEASKKDFTSFCMQFDDAALDRLVLAATLFYRSLMSAATSFENNPSPLRNADMTGLDEEQQEAYQEHLTNIAADVYGALQAYNHFGDRALPTIEVFKDVRLSQVWYDGLSSLSVLAMDAALTTYKKIGIPLTKKETLDLVYGSTLSHAPGAADFIASESVIDDWKSGRSKRSGVSVGLMVPIAPQSWYDHQDSITDAFNGPAHNLILRRAELSQYRAGLLPSLARNIGDFVRNFIG